MKNLRQEILKIVKEEVARAKRANKMTESTITLSRLLMEATVDQLKTKYVGTGDVQIKLKSKGTMVVPQISQSDWKMFSDLKMSLGKKQVLLKPVYLDFLIKNVLGGVITMRDAVEKFADRGSNPGLISLHASAQYKNKFANVDINGYRDAKDFYKDAVDIKKTIEDAGSAAGVDEGNLVSATDILKLKGVGVKLLGMVAGYQCFKVPMGSSNETFKVYSDVLGRCSGRSSGDSVNICTMQGLSHFQTHTSQGPMYVFFNMKDRQSPYQFQYESNQFMNRENKSVI